MTVDFRRFYHVSVYDFVEGRLPFQEGYDLFLNLHRMSESLIYSKKEEVKPLTIEAVMLARVHNAIIQSIPAKKGSEKKKRDLLIQLDIPKSSRNLHRKSFTKEEAESFFSHVKIAEA